MVGSDGKKTGSVSAIRPCRIWFCISQVAVLKAKSQILIRSLSLPSSVLSRRNEAKLMICHSKKWLTMFVLICITVQTLQTRLSKFLVESIGIGHKTKRPITFIFGDSALFISINGFKTLPIKDTSFLSSLIFLGVDIFIFLIPTRIKVKQKKYTPLENFPRGFTPYFFTLIDI